MLPMMANPAVDPRARCALMIPEAMPGALRGHRCHRNAGRGRHREAAGRARTGETAEHHDQGDRRRRHANTIKPTKIESRRPTWEFDPRRAPRAARERGEDHDRHRHRQHQAPRP